MREERIKQHLTELLMDVPLARGQGDDSQRLCALCNAILFYPTFRDWPSPVMEWINEAQQLSEMLDDTETAVLIGIRHAVVLMRTDSLDSALRQLEIAQTIPRDIDARLRCYAAVARSRIYTRRQEFDLAQSALEEAAAIPVEASDWITLLPDIARGELFLEKNEIVPAQRLFLSVLKQLPLEMVEERVQVLQSLSFIYITQIHPKSALRYLDEARQVLRGAGIWSEVIQMNLVVANLCIPLGKTKRAERLFLEALELCQQHQQPTWEAVLQLGLARSRFSRRAFQDAVEASLKAAVLFAKQGNAVGYVSMITYISRIHREDHNHREAYRVLALGVSIAKQLRLPTAESVFRVQINTLRNELLGPEKFDRMVQEMVSEAKSSNDDKI